MSLPPGEIPVIRGEITNKPADWEKLLHSEPAFEFKKGADADNANVLIRDCGVFVTQKRIPAAYLAATWRNTTPVDDHASEIGIGFNLASGGAMRFRLDVIGARHLAESIAHYLLEFDARSQSNTSSGSPSVAVSTPDE